MVQAAPLSIIPVNHFIMFDGGGVHKKIPGEARVYEGKPDPAIGCGVFRGGRL